MTAAGVCYAIGSGRDLGWSLDPNAPANAWLLVALAMIILAAACDMLDGTVARRGNMGTQFGAFLDSTLDRYSDFAIYAGIAAWFASVGNITFTLLPMIAFFNGFMISYSRARAEDIINRCRVGYWQRGERVGAVLFGTIAYNIPALVVQQALLPLLSVARRIGWTKHVIEGRHPIEDPRDGGFWLKVRIWRYPRGTIAYDVVTGLNILWLLVVRFEPVDVLRVWLLP
jgi:CDP-diacylglycerol--glycerol-3-phosphate 3-phosphatidyltransferase